MTLFIPLLLPALFGYLVCEKCLRTAKITKKPLLAAVLALPIGFGLSSVIMFWSYVGAASHAPMITFFIVLTAVCVLSVKWGLAIFGETPPDTQNEIKPKYSFRIISRDPGRLFTSILNLLAFIFFVFFLLLYVEYFLAQQTGNIYGGWDARYFWNLKAKFLFRDPAQWKAMFSSELDWAHPDYPLFIPASVAWGWQLIGAEAYGWTMMVDFILFVPLGLLVLWYLGTQVSWWCGWLASGFLFSVTMYRFWSTTQYADVPLCFFITSACLMAVCGLRAGRHLGLFILAGVLAGLSAWTKNEGIFFIGWLSLLLVPALLTGSTGRLLDRLKPLGVFLASCSVPFACVIFLKVFLGAEGGEYLGSGRSATDYFGILFGDIEKTKFISLCFLVFSWNFSQWHGLWVLFLAGLVLCGKNGYRQYRWLLPASVLLIWFGYFMVLHVTPHSIKFQVETALLRLLMHSGAIALVFAFESLLVWKLPARIGETTSS